MSATTSTSVGIATPTLRETAASGTATAEQLVAALLGGWPARSEGPTDAARELVALAETRDPAAVTILRGLLAAEPALVTQLARLSSLTSLTRSVDGCVAGLDVVEYRQRLAGIEPAAGADPGEWVAGRAADLAAERTPAPEVLETLAELANLEAECHLARAEGSAARAGDRWPGLFARWGETASDLARLTGRLATGETGDPQAVRSRFASVAGAEAMAALVTGAESWPGGQRLARIFKQLAQSELRVEDPAAAFNRLLALVASQGERPLLAADPDPLLLGIFVLERGRGSWLQFDLPGERLANARRQGFEPPHGVVVVGEALHVACTPLGAELPPAPNRIRAAVAEEEKDESMAGLKQLVLTNLGTISVLLEFLRDQKIISIPGLVEEIANRTRNPQVLETIATTRNLHTGFANRNVPLALLKSPVNVSVRTLRRFIHVKFVSKLELKRMAADKSGLRKEVHREIEKYLATLH